MLASVDSDLNHVIHINVFLLRMSDFEEMNRAYVEMMGDHRPARTAIGVHELPKPGILLTMNLTAVTRSGGRDHHSALWNGTRVLSTATVQLLRTL
jgi:2-iminobutanoate/2-iminopropanoate deaminase